jgi:hypothetical protein
MIAQRRIMFMRPMLAWHTLNENIDVKHFRLCRLRCVTFLR